MHLSPFILSGDEGLIKIAIFVIFAIIWGIGALASAAKKASEQAKRRAAMRLPTSPPVTVSRQNARILAQHGVTPVAVPIAPRGANSSAIRGWLRPASLRKQFILTELLQPPLALRQTHESRGG